MSVYDLTGRKALVTGGARGLGEGMARALARAGASVVIGDIREDLGKACADSLRSRRRQRRVRAARHHRRRELGCRRIPQVIAHLGGLDILVNNAGVEITSLLVDIDPAEVRRQLEVNVLGTALGLKHGFRAMRPGGPAGAGGSIVNVASVAATIAFPGIAIYSATKSAVDRLTKVAAMESGRLGYGVRVNCVYPGLVPTEMGNQLANDCAAIGLFPTAADAAMAVAGLTPLGRLGEVAGDRRRGGVPRLGRGQVHHRGRAPGRRRHGNVRGIEMSDKKKVVVYGASGYTGRLVCEYLREFNVPFIAAGRDKARIAEALETVPGIGTVDHEIVEVEHAVGPLSELFDGASVVCNMVGPFATYGAEVVEACLATGCHYLDTTGEQDWLIDAEAAYGARMAAAGLLLAPGVAQMYTTGEIAAQLCLEQPGLDTLDILVFWKGAPTVASTRTILVNAALAKAYYLEQNGYAEWPADGGLYTVTVPGQHETGLALPWGGTSHPVWFSRDPRVANVKVLGGVFNRPLMLGVPQIVAAALAQIADLPEAEKHRVLAEQAAAVMNQMPPREYTRINTSLDSVHASGPARPGALHHPRQLQLQADRPAPGVRRLLAAAAAAAAGRVRVRLPGVRPPRAARRAAQFRPGDGARAHQVELREDGAMRLVDFLDKGASVHPIDAPCLTMAGQARSYADVQRLSWSVGRALARSGIRPGDKVAVLSGNDPVAFASVFGISRAGAVWCPVNPRNEAAENRELLGAARLPLPDLRRRLRAAGGEDRAGPARADARWSAWTATPAAPAASAWPARSGSPSGWPGSATIRGRPTRSTTWS